MKNLIEVDNCLECPFSNNDDYAGRDKCNLNPKIKVKGLGELPGNKIHDKCPLRTTYIIVRTK